MRGFPWLKFEGWKPRLFLNEKQETLVKWSLRTLTALGIIASILTVPWYVSSCIAIALVLLDAIFENVLFYYTSMYILPIPDFKWEPDKWTANFFVSFGDPQDPASDRIVGLVFSDSRFAKNLFDLLKAWNNGSAENTEDNFFLSFIIDEDTYYVYLYPNHSKQSVKEAHAEIEEKNLLKKYGKEHIGMVMQMIICKGFHTDGDFALKQFIDNQPYGEHFLLGPFLWNGTRYPQPIAEIEPISMIHYKAKIPAELTEDETEYWHWKIVVERDRVAVGETA